MSTSKAISMTTGQETIAASFEKFAGACTIAAGIINFLYAVAFVVIARSNPSLGLLLTSLFLLASGLLVTTMVTALYQRLRAVDAAFALWAFLLGLIGSLGAAVHGGYDLGNALTPPPIGSELTASLAALPSQIDPRGLTTFGVMGLALFVFTWLMSRTTDFPRGLIYLGYIFAGLFIILYLARLIVFDPTNLILVVPVLITGFVVNPVWHIWLGLTLWRGLRK